MAWWTILNIVVLVAAVVLPFVALGYGVLAFGWGFRRYPKSTSAVAVLLVFALIVAAMTYNRLFPDCSFSITQRGFWCH